MLSDPAAAAWIAANRPAVDAPPPVLGKCARCGSDEPTVTSSRIISEKFTGFELWPYGTRRLCVPCAWAYSRQPTAQLAMLITSSETLEYSTGSHLAPVLSAGPLHSTQAAVLPTAKRRHILPTAQWAHLAVDGLLVAWDTLCARRLGELVWLRADLGATWPQLSRPAPPAQLVTDQPPEHWQRVMTAWTALQPWRRVPPMWAAARILTNPPKAGSPQPTAPCDLGRFPTAGS
ncbi:Uncharacterised protein [Mycobacteroides abscessus subsp. abscessus]|uniref:hypothetical protein n=1 Tax=Mycobacteroides abscessus TaxID=36809 RepID=UPI00092C8984|nr:hypothetical protein [Mycobacteroides abscessus]SIJ22384.1 Uncharacterised protein [Mycobacteroides abscessus subsp. abscessus]SLH38379.1 Uncharacterised protein [Mycobacteroides abscessus subsp. abscessus]